MSSRRRSTVGLLQVSQPKLRSRFYEEDGLTGSFDPVSRSVEAFADLGVRKGRVGGALDPLRTRIELGARCE